MSSRKVRKGQCLFYYPNVLDMFDARTDLKSGEEVRVIHPKGCPPPNTMGHCHVERVTTGEFVGLVCTNSLHTKEEMEEAGLPVYSSTANT